MPGRGFVSFCWAALLVFGGLFLVLGVQHVRYPGFVELMEADSLQQIARIAQGQPAYPLPDGEFIALAYTPLYDFVSAPFYLLLGDGFAGPRLVSLLAALASGGLVFLIARRESGSPHLGALAAAFFFAGYHIMDAWLTCALPDSLFLCLLLSGFWYLAYGTLRRHDFAWLLCFTLAFWTKQHGAFFFGFAVLYALLFRKNALPRWAFVAGLIVGGPVSYFTLAPLLGDGFIQQTLVVPGHWERSLWLSIRRTVFVLAEFVPFALVLTSIHLLHAVRLRPLRVPALAWFVVTSLIATTATMTVAGSSNNHYIPFIASLCIASALGVDVLLKARPTRGLQFGLAAGLGMALVVSGGVTFIAKRQFAEHPIPVFVPVIAAAALLGCLALIAAQRWFPSPAGEGAGPDRRGSLSAWNAALAALLAAAQLAGECFNPAQDLADARFPTHLARLQSELRGLDGSIIWLPYGRVPRGLAGVDLVTVPSTVALEDLARQQNVPDTEAERLAPFFGRVTSLGRLYVLSAEPLEQTVIWKDVPAEWTLVRDFGREFSGVKQITVHWFGGGHHPRYLYRMLQPGESPQHEVTLSAEPTGEVAL